MAAHKRILSSLGNGPTRRNLFGPVDREQLTVEYQAALRKDLEEASRRWGFDFISDKPLESSDFQWEGIPGTKVPLLYRSCMFGLGPAQDHGEVRAAVCPKAGRVGPSDSEKENILRTPERCIHNLEKTPLKRENTGLKRKQTNITDFYQAKRRVVGMPRKSGEWFIFVCFFIFLYLFFAVSCKGAKIPTSSQTILHSGLHRLCTIHHVEDLNAVNHVNGRDLSYV